MPEKISKRVSQCYKQAELYFTRNFPLPEIRLDLRGQAAGAAYPQRNLLRFNAALYRNNTTHFLQQTVAHEVAHLLVNHLHGFRVRPHGIEWQNIMLDVFQLPAQRCHDYQLPPAWKNLYSYACSCRLHDFSPQRHSQARRGTRYMCRVCQQPLSFTGNMQRKLVER